MKFFRMLCLFVLLVLALACPVYADEETESGDNGVSESDVGDGSAGDDSSGFDDKTDSQGSEVKVDDNADDASDGSISDSEVADEPDGSDVAEEGQDGSLPVEDGGSGDGAGADPEDGVDSGAGMDGDAVDDSVDYAGDALSGIYNLLAESELFSVDDNSYPSTAPLQAGCYIQADTSQLGRVMIYIPFTYQEKSFTFDRSGNLVNISGSTVSGLVYRGSTSYTFRVSSFSTPQYRSTSSSSSYVDLTIEDVVSTNVQILDDGQEVPLYPSERMVQFVMVFLLGVVVCRLFMMRS